MIHTNVNSCSKYILEIVCTAPFGGSWQTYITSVMPLSHRIMTAGRQRQSPLIAGSCNITALGL